MKKNIDKSKLSAEEQTALDALLAKSATDITDTPAPPTTNKDEEIIKSLPPEAQAIIEKSKTEAAEALAEARRATEAATFEKHARETNEFVADNIDLMKGYPGKPDDNAKLLYRVKKAVTPADYTEIEKLFKAGGAALASATSEKGTTKGGDVAEQTIMQELSEKAHARAAEKNISYSKAYDEILDENSDKVQEVRKAKKRRERAQDND